MKELSGITILSEIVVGTYFYEKYDFKTVVVFLPTNKFLPTIKLFQTNQITENQNYRISNNGSPSLLSFEFFKP